jgi:superfamily II DNA or RNA helicase
MDLQQAADTKSELQLAWRTQWVKNDQRGTLAGATGMGKTKPAIDVMMDLWGQYLMDPTPGPPRIFLAVPTEKLRDTGWPEEVYKWYGDEGIEMWKECVTAECYISIHKTRNQRWNLVILDEAHWLTPLSALFFKHNTYDAVMGMTATAPDKQRDPDKYDLLKQIAPVVFTYSLDQGVEDGVVADFELRVVMLQLDDTIKNIKAGTKIKPFLTTEKAHYDYLCKRLKQLYIQANQAAGIAKAQVENRIKFATLDRTRFIYNLPSKTKAAKHMMNAVLPGKRTLLFCGSIAQCDELCGQYVYHSKSKDEYFHKFKAGEGEYMGTVNAVNEGQNIVDLDQALVVQVNSNERHLVQRVGRAVRIREGHKATVWILSVQGTVDEKWTEKALANFDPSKVIYDSLKNY